jgi:hypothetical protein
MIFDRLFRRGSSSAWADGADDALVQRLEAVALNQVPDVAQRVARRREALLAEYLRAAGQRAARTSFRPMRLAPALAGAVLLIVLTAGGLAASGPGLPLYGLRLAAEEVFLPAGGAERLAAQLDRLDRRLDEAFRASDTGDATAAASALHAYERIATELQAGQHPGATQIATVAERLRHQVQRLERLQLAEPGATGPAKALGSADAMLLWLAAPDLGDPSPSPAPASAEPTPSASPQSSAGQTGHPSPGQTGSGSSPPGPSAGASATGGPAASGGEGGPSASPRAGGQDRTKDGGKGG